MDLALIEKAIRPVVENCGLTLYDIDFHGRTLKVFIQKEGGVTIQDCVDASRLINALLDVDEDIVPGGSYELEVGSPGLDRDLKKPVHFKAAIGEVIHVVTLEPMSKWNQALDVNDKFFEKRKKIKGELKSFEENKIKLITDGREVLIPLSAVSKSYVDFEVSKGEKRDLKPKSKKGR